MTETDRRREPAPLDYAEAPEEEPLGRCIHCGYEPRWNKSVADYLTQAESH